MAVVKFILFVIILFLVVAIFTLFRNDANLFQAPGLSQRLAIFLSTNMAETSDDHQLEELRTPTFDISAESLQKHVMNAITALRWDLVSHDRENQSFKIIVRSPVLLFEDDVFVQVQFLDTNKSSLYIRSSSRKGKADFAANSGHIQALIGQLKN